MSTNDNPPPVHQVRVGTCRAAIWKNEADGQIFHTASFSRLYKTDDGWRSRSSFGVNDLPHLALLAQETYRAIAEFNAGVDPATDA